MSVMSRSPILKHSEWESIDIGISSTTPLPLVSPKSNPSFPTREIYYRHVQPFLPATPSTPLTPSYPAFQQGDLNNRHRNEGEDEDDEETYTAEEIQTVSSLFPLPPTYSEFNSTPYTPRSSTAVFSSPYPSYSPSPSYSSSSSSPNRRSSAGGARQLLVLNTPTRSKLDTSPYSPRRNTTTTTNNNKNTFTGSSNSSSSYRSTYSTFPPFPARANHDMRLLPGTRSPSSRQVRDYKAGEYEDDDGGEGDDCYSDHLDLDDYLYDPTQAETQLHQPTMTTAMTTATTPSLKADKPALRFIPVPPKHKSKFLSKLLLLGGGSGGGLFNNNNNKKEYEPLLPLHHRNLTDSWKGIGPGLRVLVPDQGDSIKRARNKSSYGRVQGWQRMIGILLWVLFLLLILVCLGHFAWKVVNGPGSEVTEAGTGTACSNARPKFCHLVIGAKD